MSYEEIEQALETYATGFPFSKISFDEIVKLENRLGKQMPLLLRQLYSKIGQGSTFLTGQFVAFDSDLSLTTDMRFKHFANSWPSKRHYNYDDALINSALVIGCTDSSYYFVATDEPTDNDPTVYFYYLAPDELDFDQGPCDRPERLSNVILQFRYFNSPKEIPQHLVDEAWFKTRIGFSRPLNLHRSYEEIEEWVAQGRPGMQDVYKNHPRREATAQATVVKSVFSPDFAVAHF